jgi:hypothetical protein
VFIEEAKTGAGRAIWAMSLFWIGLEKRGGKKKN